MEERPCESFEEIDTSCVELTKIQLQSLEGGVVCDSVATGWLHCGTNCYDGDQS